MSAELDKLNFSLDKFIEELTTEFLSLRSNRPTTKLVEDINVDAYGSKMPIKQIGSISVTPPREITIVLWDANLAKPTGEAIQEALQITPAIDGLTLHVNLPALTDERRTQLIKLVSQTAEDFRIKVRSSRDYANKTIEQQEKDNTISEDQKFQAKNAIQKKVDATNKTIEEILFIFVESGFLIVKERFFSSPGKNVTSLG